MKTLDQVEPRKEINATNTPGDGNSLFRITQPGSYYLTGSITGVASKAGIEIASSNVTIDLMGFTMQGVAGSLDGINTVGAVDNLRIVNGILAGWAAHGLALINGTNHHVTSIHARSNGSVGIIVGTNGVVESCAASANVQGGIAGNGQNSVIRSCAVYNNSSQGISLNNGLVENCAADANITGIQGGAGTAVTACTARVNAANGIVVSGASIVNGCSSFGNGGDGILSNGTTITIAGCIASGNVGDGIQASGDCTLRENTCSANGSGPSDGAGIHVTGSDNRIEANQVTDNDRGIDVDLAGNVILKNSASGNTTNYDIVANNVGFYVTATTTGVVSGSSGGTTIGTTDPWANISY